MKTFRSQQVTDIEDWLRQCHKALGKQNLWQKKALGKLIQRGIAPWSCDKNQGWLICGEKFTTVCRDIAAHKKKSFWWKIFPTKNNQRMKVLKAALAQWQIATILADKHIHDDGTLGVPLYSLPVMPSATISRAPRWLNYVFQLFIKPLPFPSMKGETASKPGNADVPDYNTVQKALYYIDYKDYITKKVVKAGKWLDIDKQQIAGKNIAGIDGIRFRIFDYRNLPWHKRLWLRLTQGMGKYDKLLKLFYEYKPYYLSGFHDIDIHTIDYYRHLDRLAAGLALKLDNTLPKAAIEKQIASAKKKITQAYIDVLWVGESLTVTDNSIDNMNPHDGNDAVDRAPAKKFTFFQNQIEAEYRDALGRIDAWEHTYLHEAEAIVINVTERKKLCPSIRETTRADYLVVDSNPSQAPLFPSDNYYHLKRDTHGTWSLQFVKTTNPITTTPIPLNTTPLLAKTVGGFPKSGWFKMNPKQKQRITVAIMQLYYLKAYCQGDLSGVKQFCQRPEAVGAQVTLEAYAGVISYYRTIQKYLSYFAVDLYPRFSQWAWHYEMDRHPEVIEAKRIIKQEKNELLRVYHPDKIRSLKEKGTLSEDQHERISRLMQKVIDRHERWDTYFDPKGEYRFDEVLDKWLSFFNHLYYIHHEIVMGILDTKENRDVKSMLLDNIRVNPDMLEVELFELYRGACETFIEPNRVVEKEYQALKARVATLESVHAEQEALNKLENTAELTEAEKVEVAHRREAIHKKAFGGTPCRALIVSPPKLTDYYPGLTHFNKGSVADTEQPATSTTSSNDWAVVKYTPPAFK